MPPSLPHTQNTFAQTLKNNTIHAPSSADGKILSTGNLQDIKVTSSRMTSLAINARRVNNPGTALKAGGWLEFGHLESGWSYQSAYHRRASGINYPGPAFDLVTSAYDLHPRVCLHSSPADACVVSHVDMHAIHAKLNDALISAALSKAVTALLTPHHLLTHKHSKASEDTARSILDSAFEHQGLTHKEAALVAEALLRRADTADRAGVVGSGFADLLQLNARALRFGQSKYSSGMRLLPDGPARTGKLVFNLSSPTAYPGQHGEQKSSKRLVFAMEQFHQGLQDWSGAQQYADANHGGDNLLHLQVRAADGVLLTDTNLHDISAGSGSLTSLSVKEGTSIREGVTTGTPGKGQSQLQLVRPSASSCDGVRMEHSGGGKAMCFKEFRSPRSWHEAGAACRRWGGQLAVLERGEVKRFVNNHVRRTPCVFETTWEIEATNCSSNPSSDAWLALTSFEYPTLWVWTHAGAARASPLSPHSPLPSLPLVPGDSPHQQGVRDQHNSKQCAAMSPDSNFNAHNCSDQLPYLCQRDEMDRVAMLHVADNPASPAKAATHVGFSTPATNFPGLREYGKVESQIQFPSVNGTIITSGNLKDINVLALEHMNITEAVHLQGDVVLGSSAVHPARATSVVKAALQLETLQAIDDKRRGRMGGDVLRPAGLALNLYPFGGEAPTRHGRPSRLDSDWPVTPIQFSGPGGYLAGDIVFASDEAREEAHANAHLDSTRSVAGDPLLSVPSWYEVTVGNKECPGYIAHKDRIAHIASHMAQNAQINMTAEESSLLAAANPAPCLCTPWGLPISVSQDKTQAAIGDCQCGCVLKTMKSTMLSFEAALDANTVVFPDATGTIISTGNLEDIDNNVGLRGRDSFIIRHPRLSSEHLSAEERSKMLLQGKLVDTPWHIVDFARHGSREDLSIGLTQIPLPPGAAKARMPVGKEAPRGLWHIADLGAGGDFGDGDDLVYYLENMHLEPIGGFAARPSTGWTVPCTQNSLLSSTGICQSQGWAPPEVDFTDWEEYDVRLPGSGKLSGLSPLPRFNEPHLRARLYRPDAGCPGSWVGTAFIANDTHRFSREPHVVRTWDKEHRTWLPRFEQCEFEVVGAGSGVVNGLYVYAGTRDNVAQFRKPNTNVYLFRWGSMNQRISFPDATGVIITTGNPEDLIIDKMILRSLTVIGGEIGNFESPVLNSGITVLTFDKYQSLMSGDLQLVNSCVTPEGEVACIPSTEFFTSFGILQPVHRDIYTDGSENWLPEHCRTLDGVKELMEECFYCTAGAECEDKNEIYIPDVSGTVITSSNMDSLPTMAIPFSSLSAGGTTLLKGDVTLGTPAPALPSFDQTFIHPDYLRFSDSNWASKRGYECSQFESMDERCMLERDFCKHSAQVSIDSWLHTGTCHTDINAPGIKREAAMWYAPIDSNIGITLSSSGQNEAPERGNVSWGDLSTAERDLYGNRIGSENSAWKQPRGAREKSDVSRFRVSPADMSGAGKALRRFLQGGAPGIRISVDDASSENLRQGKAMLGYDLDLASDPLQSASGAAVRDSYAAARVVLQLEAGMHLSVRVRKLSRTQVMCTSDPLWRDSRNNDCGKYSANFSLARLPAECYTPANGTGSVVDKEDRAKAHQQCCQCGGGTRVHPVEDEVVVVANVSAADAGPSTPEALLLWLNQSAHRALNLSDAWLAVSLQQPPGQREGSTPLQGAPTVRMFAGRGTYGARHDSPPAPTFNCTKFQLLSNDTTCSTVQSLPLLLEAAYDDLSYLYRIKTLFYHRAEEVMSVEVLGASSLLPLLGFPAQDLILFTATDDYRDAAAPHTQPPLSALDANKEAGKMEEESCRRYTTCALRRGSVGRTLPTSTLVLVDSHPPTGRLDDTDGPHVWPRTGGGARHLSAMAGTVSITAERCRAEMRAANILNMHSLTLYALDHRLLQPTLLPVGPFSTPLQDDRVLAKAFDRRLDTGVWIPGGGVFGMELEQQGQPRVLRFVLCPANATGLDDTQTAGSGTYSTSALQGARLEGSNQSASEGFADLGPLLALDPSEHVPVGVYLTTLFPDDMAPVRWLRATFPPAPPDVPVGLGSVCLAEIEVHVGARAADLSDVQAGADSFRVDSALLYLPYYNTTAYMVCYSLSLSLSLSLSPSCFILPSPPSFPAVS
jgi:hypothetical protein